jgi:menaquinone-dependent protoporphyrinogen oxidase
LGNWLKDARRFLDTHAPELAQRPTWLFASGPIVGEPPVADDPNALRDGLVERLIETTHAREHKVFAGKLDSSTLGLLEKAAVRGAHASEGDYRDWNEIERWATEIAGQLRTSTEPATGAAHRLRANEVVRRQPHPSVRAELRRHVGDLAQPRDSGRCRSRRSAS